MEIVVVSDSHGRNDILKTIQEKHPNAKLFIHCGDLEDDPMNYPGYIIVRGNNDYFGRFENERIIPIGKHQIYHLLFFYIFELYLIPIVLVEKILFV